MWSPATLRSGVMNCSCAIVYGRFDRADVLGGRLSWAEKRLRRGQIPWEKGLEKVVGFLFNKVQGACVVQGAGLPFVFRTISTNQLEKNMKRWMSVADGGLIGRTACSGCRLVSRSFWGRGGKLGWQRQ